MCVELVGWSYERERNEAAILSERPAVLAAFAKRGKDRKHERDWRGVKDSRTRRTRSIGAKEKAYKNREGKKKPGAQSPQLALAAVSRRSARKDRDSAISRLIPHVRARRGGEESLIKRAALLTH